ncbi:MAG: NAD(P)/FAD-dependent oxidoreductase [Hyphomicrobiaceae bacterium]|nr:NAD(P)/FAD-dependent oxidoreductase [Hyphomicrobiaceae bacterium]
MPTPSTGPDGLDVIIIGAGVGGLYAIHKLRGLGFKVRAYEKGHDVGGTWYWNRYPGCRCDVESLEYSFSFSPELDQEWKWPERYGNQGEILKYVQHVADRFDLRKDVQFNTTITAATFDERSSRWTVTTDKGETITAPYCIMATGNLSTPRKPDIKGIDSFQGKWYHTGLWPHEGVDFTGLRVGVIGTGSSGVQSIPHIAKQARQLFVFQRTANFSLPAQNGPMDPVKEAKHKAEYPQRRAGAVDTPFAIAGYPPPTKSALEVSEEERNATYERKWQEGGSISFLYAYTDLLTNKAANDTASEFVRNKIRSIVQDKETAEALCPNDHPIGTKRLILDTNYYQTYNLPHVKLVNIRKNPIEEITPFGIKTADGKAYELDAIVFATGFDAMTGAMKEIDIKGKNGTSISEKWKDGPQTYLGVMVAGFPNMFMITGPQSPGVKSQMIFSCQQHVDFIGDAITYARGRQMRRIEASRMAEMAWVQHNNEVANSTLYPMANSWYMGANIPGKPRIFMPYVGGVQNYVKKCNEVAEKGYEGFEMSA